MGFIVEQLHPDPLLRPLKHDHKLTLIFFSLSKSALRNENPWMKRGDAAVIWPLDWLPKEAEGLGDNILVLCVRCYVQSGKESWLTWGTDLVQPLVMNTTLDRPQTIVLVGHGLGGLMLKSFTMEVDKLSKVDKANGELQKARCKAFQQNIKGIVFYSVPHTTSEEECTNYWKSYPNKDISWVFYRFPKLFSQDIVSFNVAFEKSIEQQDINLFAFVEGQKVSISQSSTYKLTRNNVCKIEDADWIQVCQPLDQQHDSYKRFLQFIQEALDDDELRLKQFNTKFNLKDSQGLEDQSTSIGLSNVVQKPHLTRKEKQKVKTSTKSNEIKGVPSEQQKLDAMIRTIDGCIQSPEKLKDLAPKEVLGETSIVCVGGKAMEGDSGEFLFMDVGDMVKVVGVGLDWAKVVVTKDFGVNVMQEDEGAWTKLWCLEHFVPRIITIPNPKQELVTHPNSAKTDGVELEANLGCVYVEKDKAENVHACFPLVFELAKHIGLGSKNAMKMKEVSRAKSSGSTKGGEVSGAESSGFTKGGEVSGVESSGSTKGGEVSGAESSGSTKGGAESSGSTKGGEVSRAESSGSTKGGEASGAESSGSRQEIRRNEDDEGSKDPSRGPPNPLDPSLSIGQEDVEERTLTVNVHPKARQVTISRKGQKITPSICPTLVFKFQKKGECRTIDVDAETQCNFGKMQIGAAKTGLGFYQDNITISLDSIDKDEDAATVTKAHVQKVENVKKTIVDTSTTIHYSTHQVGGELELDATPLPHNLPLHARGKYNYAWTGGDNLAHGNTQEMYFSQLDCFFVDDHSIQSELRYNFQYPQEVLQDIALGDSSKIKTEKTFRPTIVSNWVNLNMNDQSPYIFSVERHIISKEHLKRSLKCEGNPPFLQKHYEVNFNETGQLDRSMITQSPIDIHLTINEGSEVTVIKQCYKVNLKVNHAMTHMPHKAKVIPLRHSDTNPMIVEGVMEMSSSTPY